jgi:hypothetical protein
MKVRETFVCRYSSRFLVRGLATAARLSQNPCLNSKYRKLTSRGAFRHTEFRGLTLDAALLRGAMAGQFGPTIARERNNSPIAKKKYT